MTFLSFFQQASRGDLRSGRGRGRSRERLAAAAVLVALSLVVVFSLAPPAPPTASQMFHAYLDTHAQALKVSDSVAVADVTRDGYSATPGIATLVAGGTNYDWAKLVLLEAGLPINDTTVTVFTRWMRQENGVDDWWNRNNPLNNGWGSGGGGGTGSYDSLQSAAQNAAEALLSNGGYSGIVAAFSAASSTDSIEQAIWASSWASGHYDNGGHWSYAPVPIVSSPGGTWG
ncbi:MAG: hypothetical protein ABJA94_00165 [Rhodoglobus sp.]